MSREHMQNGLVSVGTAAQSVGVPTSTLRYYEKLHLLVPDGRGTNGYRLYSAAQVERLSFIRAAQAAGFTLDDIQRLLALSEQPAAGCRSSVQHLIAARLADVDRKLLDLKRVREVLELALVRCRRSRNTCPVLSELSSKSSKGEERWLVERCWRPRWDWWAAWQRSWAR